MIPVNLPPEDQDLLLEGHRYLDAEISDKALKVAEDLLLRHADDIHGMSLAAETLLGEGRYGLAGLVYKRLVDLAPNQWQFWNNFGRCYHETVRYEQAAICFKRAMALAPAEFSPVCNLIQSAIYGGDIDGAEELALRAVKNATTAEQVLKIERGQCFIHFARKDWAEGWRTFDLDLGTKRRRDMAYNNEPRWDGTNGKRVVIYGEQGLGDEILFASMYPEALTDCEAILECDERLAGLFKRSFPQAVAVHGTRHARHRKWVKGAGIEARCAAGSLGGLYRQHPVFPKHPYLKPDPVRMAAFRAALHHLVGDKRSKFVGLAWTGGTWRTREKERSLMLSQLKPILEKENCTFISLEYKDRSAEIARFKEETGITIHDWPWAARTKDYDDTAALVSELDAVVCVTTTVGLLAGALGKETHVLVNEFPTWHWGQSGEMPWLPLTLYRKTTYSWQPVIEQIAEQL